MVEALKAPWRYRQFIFSSVRNEFRNRYVRSRIGAAWAVLQPLAQALIFTFILSEVLRAKLGAVETKAGYAIYVMSGSAAWSLFNEIVTRCLNIFIEYGASLKKIAFPKLCLPIIALTVSLINHLLLLGVLLIVFSAFGQAPGAAWLALPAGMGLISLLALGIGVLFGVLNVFSRDVAQTFVIVLQFWFWLTPIIYPIETLPPDQRWLLSLNPLTPLVKLYQDAILFDRFPVVSELLFPAALALALASVAAFVFGQASVDIVDAL